ncbi:MAG: DNA-binding response OmpR family regulator [Myxococcota bacterium]|jgi:DNA-binding response OmpR family regulator
MTGVLTSRVLNLGGVIIDLNERTSTVKGTTDSVTERQAEPLGCVADRDGEVVSKRPMEPNVL